MTNCPNCGAVITGHKCEYCGTVFKQQPDIERYRTENEYIKQQVAIENAFMMYAKGLLTANEVRKII